MAVLMLVDQQELIYISTVRSQDIIWKTCQKSQMIVVDEEIESGKSVLSVQFDDNDDDVFY